MAGMLDLTAMSGPELRQPGCLTNVPIPLTDSTRPSFGFDGTEYEIDLSEKNARAFRAQLAPFVEHACKRGRGGPARRATRTAAGRQRSGEVRAWAKDQGLSVSARGRIPASVMEQYQRSKGN
jgi:hypothetical protein